MRRLLVALVIVGALCASAVAELTTAPAANAATTVITFDDLPANTTLTNQYASRGVVFTGTRILSNASLARSDPQFVSCYSGAEFCDSAHVGGSFSPPQSRVKVWVGHLNTSPATITLRAFNSAGALLGSASASFSRVTTPAATPLEVTVANAVITRFDVNSTDFHENTVVDDLEFQRPDPTVTLNPSCRGSTAQTLTLTARGYTPNSFGYVLYDAKGPEEQARSRLPIDGTGTFSTTFATTASGREIAITAYDLDGVRLDVRWSPCPPPGVTTTTSTTVPDSVPDTTTTTRPPGGGVVTTTTSTTIPTIVTIPPPTPGAALMVTPSLGPGGFVATAIGSGFPGNQPVTLGWSPGIGIYSVTASPDGTFITPMLVMNRDVLGPRTLVATSGAVSASASFLVVPSTVQPSGKDVAQINRTRRFLQR